MTIEYYREGKYFFSFYQKSLLRSQLRNRVKWNGEDGVRNRKRNIKNNKLKRETAISWTFKGKRWKFPAAFISIIFALKKVFLGCILCTLLLLHTSWRFKSRDAIKLNKYSKKTRKITLTRFLWLNFLSCA